MSYDLYCSSADDSVRFLLGKEGDNRIVVIGLNPSTATQEKSDTTATKVERAAIGHGFRGFALANLYPVRSTHPTELPPTADPQLLDLNTRHIGALARKDTVFWAAWGGGIVLRPYLAESLIQIAPRVAAAGGRWVCFGALSKDGHPRHPSRLCYRWQFSEFDISSYGENLRSKHRASRTDNPRELS